MYTLKRFYATTTRDHPGHAVRKDCWYTKHLDSDTQKVMDRYIKLFTLLKAFFEAQAPSKQCLFTAGEQSWWYKAAFSRGVCKTS